MNIGELIELLTAAADDLPGGMASEVRVHLCSGRDRFAIFTKAVTLDTTESVVLVQGHPHLDTGGTVRRPLTMGVDDELAQMVCNPAAQPKSVPEFVTVQIGHEKAYRLPLRATGEVLEPGDLEALRVGCLCDPGRNEWARNEASSASTVAYIIHEDCPVHQTVDLPTETGGS